MSVSTSLRTIALTQTPHQFNQIAGKVWLYNALQTFEDIRAHFH
jgi:hypothetical protein